MSSYAIIGFGCAGYQAARAIRGRDESGVIDVFSDVGFAPSNPMLTTYYTKGALHYEGMFPFGTLPQIAEQLSIRFHGGQPVTGLDAKRRTLVAGGREAGPYDKILISTGASAFVPPIPGHDLPGVMPMRTAADAERLKRALAGQPIRTALVVGASMTGIKLVELLCAAGVKTTMVDGAGWMFPLAAFQSTAQRIQARLEQKGVLLAFNALLSEIREQDGRLCGVMKDGRSFPADIVLICIGTRTNLAFLKDSGIEINRGVLVDHSMRTSAPGIYAAGDCCESFELQSGTQRVVGLWMNAGLQGRAAGENMAGGQAKFDFNIVQNISHFMDVDFISMGDVHLCGEQDDYYENSGGPYYIKAARDGSGVKCINLLGRADSSGALKNGFIKSLLRSGPIWDRAAICRLLAGGVPESFIAFMRRAGNDRA